jgi:DNA-binding NtrC family response regulator
VPPAVPVAVGATPSGPLAPGALPTLSPPVIPHPQGQAQAGTVATNGPQPLLSLPTVGEAGLDLDATLASVERLLVVDALRVTGGNKNRAAALLRLPRTTFLERLKRLGL